MGTAGKSAVPVFIVFLLDPPDLNSYIDHCRRKAQDQRQPDSLPCQYHAYVNDQQKAQIAYLADPADPLIPFL